MNDVNVLKGGTKAFLWWWWWWLCCSAGVSVFTWAVKVLRSDGGGDFAWCVLPAADEPTSVQCPTQKHLGWSANQSTPRAIFINGSDIHGRLRSFSRVF